jgi:hypothetical protein
MLTYAGDAEGARGTDDWVSVLVAECEDSMLQSGISRLYIPPPEPVATGGGGGAAPPQEGRGGGGRRGVEGGVSRAAVGGVYVNPRHFSREQLVRGLLLADAC